MIVTCVESLVRALQDFVKTWEKVQVELHGTYSAERLRSFYSYSLKISWPRLLFWCIWIPIPCLAYNIFMDIAPLAKPSAGRDENYMFWIRCAFITFPFNYGFCMQIGILTPNLEMTRKDVIATSAVVTPLCTGYAYFIAGYIPMPVPFLFLVVAPPCVITIVIVFSILFGKKLKRDSELRTNLYRASIAVNCQLMLNFIYPIYIYGFNSIPSGFQTPYVMLLALVKITTKNIMSKLVRHMDDLKPGIIVFNVDLFHALYVSLAMQQATTISTSLVVMLIDAAQMCVSIYDVSTAFQPLRLAIESLPVTHPLHGKKLLEIARILDQEASRSNKSPTTHVPRQLRHGFTKSNKVFVESARFTGISAKSELHISSISTDEVFGGHSESFLLAVRRLLFMVEFVMLTEYAEVVIPIFYSVYTTAIYHLPNREFYAAVATIDEERLRSTVVSILEYAGLEVLSLTVISVAIYRMTGLSPLQQVGFVLERQYGLVQCQLFTWVMYALQNSLQHLGADFSFKFAWLHSRHA